MTTFGDQHVDTSDPYYRIESVSHEYLHTLDGSEPTCAHCGAAASLSLEPRRHTCACPTRRRALVRMRAAERAAAERDVEALSVGQRQAALERLADGAGSENAELAALRAEIAELRAQLQNGHEPEPDPTRPSDIAPRPRKRSAA